MPIFEYICQDCGKEFEVIVRNRDATQCPKCHGTKLEQKLSVFAVASGGSSFESRMPSSGGGCACGDPNGPCSMNDD
jgi:putative FmdB family regulatory protein